MIQERHREMDIARFSKAAGERVVADGKLFRLAGERWYLKGLTYGPFSLNSQGLYLPERPQMQRDFRQMQALGANAIRLYHIPPISVLDDALEHGLRVFLDVPWEKHRCFFEDWRATESAKDLIRQTARDVGNHPGLFAISIGNEIPKDVVRFYGHRRIEKFLASLIHIAKREAPDCLVTYTNYPSTEFLIPPHLDFYCYNVYLDNPGALGDYLDRLQHFSGSAPLILGEYGVDTICDGENHQAALLGSHIQSVFRHGLAGSFVFSFTDDWYTGGHQITDWAFGITDLDRRPKLAAEELQNAWAAVPSKLLDKSPRVSVVVCSYNGASTLEECLQSLQLLDYPDYEVILVHDGSTDHTPQIASDFPEVRYIRQENMGLSVARNVGALAATGTIVAYTDSDCVVDQGWLRYLIAAMEDQKVDAIGGPNIPPPSDCSIAKCVAASPGGPSHVMLDDRQAEHIPGCNMAFDRAKHLSLGGFDKIFRVAGDDVDICWRLLDAGYQIGYAASAFVWHHRRTSVRAYLKQQAGYGRSEGLLYFKHPARFNALGCSRWAGTIYGEGAVGMPRGQSTIYHGRFGFAPFQILYRDRAYSFWTYFTLLEWHFIAALFAVLSLFWLPFAAVCLAMWTVTLVTVIRSAHHAILPPHAPLWSRPLIGLLYLLQPMVRAWHRYKLRVMYRKLPEFRALRQGSSISARNMLRGEIELHWNTEDGRGRERLLETILTSARALGWVGAYGDEWGRSDINLIGDPFHDMSIFCATEELGGPKRFTRARCVLNTTGVTSTFTMVLLGVLAIAATSTVLRRTTFDGVLLSVIGMMVLGWAALLILSRYRCLRAAGELLLRGGRRAKLGMPLNVMSNVNSDQRPLPENRSEQYEHVDADEMAAEHRV